MVDRAQWPVVDLGFEMVPPKLERPAGRPRVRLIKSSGEPGKRGFYRCKRCFGFGHIEKSCREPPAAPGLDLPPPPKIRKRKGDGTTSSSKNASTHTTKKSKTTTSSTSSPTQTTPDPVTRSMAASPSTPASTGPITRRRAAALDISPGGTARRTIIG